MATAHASDAAAETAGVEKLEVAENCQLSQAKGHAYSSPRFGGACLIDLANVLAHKNE